MLTGIKLPLGMMGSSSSGMGPGALLFAALGVAGAGLFDISVLLWGDGARILAE